MSFSFDRKVEQFAISPAPLLPDFRPLWMASYLTSTHKKMCRLFEASPDLRVAVECELARSPWKLTLAEPPIAVSSGTLLKLAGDSWVFRGTKDSIRRFYAPHTHATLSTGTHTQYAMLHFTVYCSNSCLSTVAMDNPTVRSAFRGCGKEEFCDSVLSYRTHQQQALLLACVSITESLIGYRHFASISSWNQSESFFYHTNVK